MAEETPERISFAYREIDVIHPKIVHKFGSTLKELDLSNNNIQDLSPLKGFTQLQVLVLDGNKVNSHTKIPFMPKLHTLWVNSNQISNLTIFVDKLVENIPNLKFLSMLKNEACPNFFNGHSLKEYNDYRQYVISRIPRLSTLDSTPITDQERVDALRVYSTLPVPKVEQNYTIPTVASPANISNSPKPTEKQKKTHKGKKKKTEVKAKKSGIGALTLPIFNTDNEEIITGTPPPPSLTKGTDQESDFDTDSNDESWTDDDDTDEWDKQ